MNNLFVLVSYDISNDRRRLKIMKTLEGFGSRVQYSVFECRLNAGQVNDLRAKIMRLVKKEDSVRFYFLCQEDIHRIEVHGSGGITMERVFYIH